MNPGTPTFRAHLENLSAPAFSILPPLSQQERVCEPFHGRCPTCGHLMQEQPSLPQLQEIERIVATHFHVPMGRLRSRRRDGKVSWARQVAIWLAVEITTASHTDIGRFFGRSNETVTYAHAVVTDKMSVYPATKVLLLNFRAKIGAASLGRTP